MKMDWLYWSLPAILILYNSVITGPTQATSRTVFRAARYDTGGVKLYDLWSGKDTSPAIDQPISWQYFDTSELHKQVLKSAILECSWDKVKQVEFAFYDAGQRVMFHTFNISGRGADKMDWFNPTYLVDSSYEDIMDTVTFVYFAFEASNTFRIKKSRGYCLSTSQGWSLVLDVGKTSSSKPDCVCYISPTGQFPVFRYSPSSSAIRCKDYASAETMLVKVTLEDNAFGGNCVSSCVDVVDGWYQSCIGCNVYIKCQSDVLTHHSCSDGHEFDDLHKACVSPQSTTCVGGIVNGSCLPPLGVGDIPAYVLNTTEEATTTGEITTTEEATATGDITTTEEATATGDTTTTEEATATGDITTTEEATATGDTTITQEATATGDITTTEEATATGDITTTEATATGDTTTTQEATATGDITTTEEATATGDITTTEEATPTGDITTTEEATATGDTNTTQEATSTGDITTTEEATATGDTTTTQEATATGDITTTEEATATGDTTTTQEATATGDITTTEEATATGDITTTEEATATGDITTTEEATATGDITTTQEATATGDITTTTEDTTAANPVGTNTRTNQCSGYGNICRFSARRVEVDAYNMAARTSVFVTNSPIQCTQRCARIPDCEFFNYRNQPNGGSEENCHAHALTTGQVIPNPPGNLTGWNVYELF